MPNIPDRFADAAYAPNSITTVYTCPAKKRARVEQFVATNSNGSGTETLDVYIVPSGGSASAANKLVAAKPFDVGQSRRLWEIEGQILRPGDLIQINASAASKIAYRISGKEASGDGISNV